MHGSGSYRPATSISTARSSSASHCPDSARSTDRRPALSAFNERLIARGYWVFAGGVGDPDAATVIDNRGEQAVVSDGPFTESKEYLGGVWVWGAITRAH